MQIFALVSACFFAVVSLVVGFRLLRLASRTHQLPEFSIGTQIFLTGGIGYSLWLFGALGLAPQALMPLVGGVSTLAIGLGYAALFFGIWRIFRPAAAWAAAAAALGVATVMGTALYDVASGHMWTTQPALSFWPSNTGMGACFAWLAIESFGHFRMMQRRHRIGLAEPALANRFLLWGMASSAAALFVTATAVNWLAFPHGTVGAPIVLVQSILGLIGSVLIWFTFYPPRALQGVLLQSGKAGASSDG